MANISSVSTRTGTIPLFEPTVAFFSISYSIISIGIVLNFIEIYLIVKKWKRATDFELVLLNLAVADVLNCVIYAMVTGFFHYIFKNRPNMSYKVKHMFWAVSFHTFSMFASTRFVIVIGVERFFAAKLPLKHRLWHTSRRKLFMCIFLTWGFDVISTVILMLVSYFTTSKSVIFASTNLSYVLAGVLTAGLVLVTIFYMWLAYLILMRSMEFFDFDNKDLSVNAKEIKRAMTKERATIVVCALVVTCLLICDLPLLADLYTKRLTKTAILLVKLNVIANPVIYFFKGFFEKHYGKKTLVPPPSPRCSGQNNGSDGHIATNLREQEGESESVKAKPFKEQ